MSKDAPTTAELRQAGIVTSQEIARAGTLWQTDPVGTYRFASGHSLDLAAAVEGYGPARCVLAEPEAPKNVRRAIVVNAILLARPKAP